MAGILAAATTAKIAITTSDTFRLLQIAAPANQRLKIKKWSVWFDEETGDATPAIPLVVKAGKHSASTGGSALTINRKSTGSETLQASALHTLTTSTLVDIETKIVNAQTGYEVMYAPGEEPILAGGEKFGIEVTSGATVSTGGLNAIASIEYEE
jgi:hypothetical protein